MKVLFDHNMPKQIRRLLVGHSVTIAAVLGWAELKNGDLLRAGEMAGFDVMLTGDQRMIYQQNNSKRNIALVVLTRIDKLGLRENIAAIASALDRAVPGGYERVQLPPRRPRRQR